MEVNKNVKNEELHKVIPIDDSPFAIVKMEDEYFLVFGKWRLSGMYDSEEAAKEAAKDTSWDFLLKVFYAVASEVYDEKSAEQVVQKTKKAK